MLLITITEKKMELQGKTLFSSFESLTVAVNLFSFLLSTLHKSSCLTCQVMFRM